MMVITTVLTVCCVRRGCCVVIVLSCCCQPMLLGDGAVVASPELAGDVITTGTTFLLDVLAHADVRDRVVIHIWYHSHVV